MLFDKKTLGSLERQATALASPGLRLRTLRLEYEEDSAVLYRIGAATSGATNPSPHDERELPGQVDGRAARVVAHQRERGP